MLNNLLAGLFLCVYGYTRRDAGGGWPNWGSFLPRFLQTIPHTLLGAVLGFTLVGNMWAAGLGALIGFAPIMFSKTTGMGQYKGIFNNQPKFIVGEKIDWIIALLFWHDPREVFTQKFADALNAEAFHVEALRNSLLYYGKRLGYRNIAGFTLLGLIGSIGVTTLLALNSMYVEAGIFTLFSATQGVVYAACWKVIGTKLTKAGGTLATEWAEFFTNFVLGVGILIVYYALETEIKTFLTALGL